METLLNDKSMPRPPAPPPPSQPSSTHYDSLDPLLFGDPVGKDDSSIVADMLSTSERYFLGHPTSMQNQHSFDADSPIMDMPMPMPMPSNILDDPPLSWELMALGLGEPLPAQDVIDSLYVSPRAGENK